MSDDKIWAPWRLGYIKGKSTLPAPKAARWLAAADESCFLCRDVAEYDEAVANGSDTIAVDRDNLTLAHGPLTITVMNRYPYNNGHILIAPRRHVARLDELTSDEHAEIAAQTTGMVTLLESVINAEGFNVGLNLGRLAGAGLPGHVHWHIVPRWNGDTNFMPVVGAVDVIPQSLEELWQAIRAELTE